MEIILADINNLESILKLNQSLFEFEKQFGNTFNLEWTFSETGKHYFRKRLTDENGVVFIAKENDQIIGYICGLIDTYSYRSINPIAEIENMYILEDFRNKKIGTNLINVFENKCKEKNVKRIRVGTIFQNTKAVDFYKYCQFKEFELILEKEIK